jgi:hypothetical protein
MICVDGSLLGEFIDAPRMTEGRVSNYAFIEPSAYERTQRSLMNGSRSNAVSLIIQ